MVEMAMQHDGAHRFTIVENAFNYIRHQEAAPLVMAFRIGFGIDSSWNEADADILFDDVQFVTGCQAKFLDNGFGKRYL